MFNTLFNIFVSSHAFNGVSNVAHDIEELLSNFESNYLKDPDARNAAIDAVIQILQKHKDNTSGQKN